MRAAIDMKTVLGSVALVLCACSSGSKTEPAAREHKAPEAEPSAPSAPPPAVLEELAKGEPLALHMRDRIGTAAQARDAIIRGRLEDATGALTWLAQHRDPKAIATAQPFLSTIHESAQRALDTADLQAAGEAVGALAATCGDCHRAHNAGPRIEPSGFEELGGPLTLENHMHAYLWATDTLWNGLIADAALWDAGVTALATQEPPAGPPKHATGFAAIRAMARSATTATTSAARGHAFGELIATCGSCHARNAIVP